MRRPDLAKRAPAPLVGTVEGAEPVVVGMTTTEAEVLRVGATKVVLGYAVGPAVVVELDRGYDQVEGVAEAVEEVEELEDHELVVMMARVDEVELVEMVELVEVRPGQLVMVGLH
jgi:hypothetical protein